MNSARARQWIRGLLMTGAARLVCVPHARARMSERKIVFSEVERILQNGVVRRDPQWCDDWKNWKCEVHGRDSEGRACCVVVGVTEENHKLVVITVYGDDDGRA